jgi:hypothetical protein
MLPFRVAAVIETVLAGAVATVGAGRDHVKVTAGTASSEASEAEKPDTLVTPLGTPEEPPPPPPPPGYGEFP